MKLPVITDAMMQELRRAGRAYTAIILEAGLNRRMSGVEAVREIMDGDPGVQAGMFTYHVHPCRGFPGDALRAAAQAVAR
jgi:hypothetical protein